MSRSGADRDRRAARSQLGAVALSVDFGLGAALPGLGDNGSRITGDGCVTSAHALIVEPFETLAFMRAALVACLKLSLANGVFGTLLIPRRASLDGDDL